MSTPTNHWKLGLFVVGGLVLALCTVVYFGASSFRKQHVDYVTYFDESVQGLEEGSLIKFRGVTVGRVADIDVAPDRRHVKVTSALSTEELGDFGLGQGEGKAMRVIVPADLRVQLVSQGITGIKFVQLDFFDEKQYPPPVLPFAAPENYIPAAKSTLKNVEDAVVSTTDRIPEMMDGLTKVTDHAASLMTQLEGEKLPEHVTRTLAHLDELMTTMNGAIVDLDLKGLSADARKGIAALNATVARANAMLAQLDGEHGLFASAQRATDAFGDVAALSPELGEEISETLRSIREATASFQRVAEALERDPDMLLKGRRVAQ